MARISGASSERIFQIKAWPGLNENPDGDTKLKYGEAAAMRNFAITRDGNLRRRAGSKAIFTLSDGAPVRGLCYALPHSRSNAAIAASRAALVSAVAINTHAARGSSPGLVAVISSAMASACSAMRMASWAAFISSSVV